MQLFLSIKRHFETSSFYFSQNDGFSPLLMIEPMSIARVAVVKGNWVIAFSSGVINVNDKLGWWMVSWYLVS